MNKKVIRLFLTLTIILILTGVMIYLTIYLNNIISNREFSNEETYIDSHPQGDVGLNVYFVIGPGSYPGSSCYGNIYFTSFAEGTLDINGIYFVKLNIYRESYHLSYDTINLEYFPKSYVSYNYVGEVYKGDNITVIGIAKVSYTINNIDYNKSFNYQVSIISPVDITQSTFRDKLPLIWIVFIVILSLIILIGSSVKVVSMIRTEIRYSNEERERDKKFWDYIKQKKNSST